MRREVRFRAGLGRPWTHLGEKWSWIHLCGKVAEARDMGGKGDGGEVAVAVPAAAQFDCFERVVLVAGFEDFGVMAGLVADDAIVGIQMIGDMADAAGDTEALRAVEPPGTTKRGLFEKALAEKRPVGGKT